MATTTTMTIRIDADCNFSRLLFPWCGRTKETIRSCRCEKNRLPRLRGGESVHRLQSPRLFAHLDGARFHYQAMIGPAAPCSAMFTNHLMVTVK